MRIVKIAYTDYTKNKNRKQLSFPIKNTPIKKESAMIEPLDTEKDFKSYTGPTVIIDCQPLRPDIIRFNSIQEPRQIGFQKLINIPDSTTSNDQGKIL